jgi:tRNA pseudouridine38-40 synthase
MANVRTETKRDLATIKRGLNALLPEDVGVLDAWEVEHDFHARHTAIRRDYRFLLDYGPVASVLLRRHAVHSPQPADLVAMQAALDTLLGTHDFVAFAGGAQEGSTVRTCYLAHCQTTEVWGQPLLAIDLAANAFLRHMVRNIVGTLLLVGEGKLNAAGFTNILAGRDRRKAGRTAPAHGLYLMSVSYP